MTRTSGFAAALLVSGMAIACSSTDAGITTRVTSQFAADDTVNAYDIHVTTHRGVVTLEGDVDSAAAKAQAVQIARTTEGVRDVVDRLAIELAADDNAIERGARATAGAAKDVGLAVRDAVTDDDPDSNNDGK